MTELINRISALTKGQSTPADIGNPLRIPSTPMTAEITQTSDEDMQKELARRALEDESLRSWFDNQKKAIQDRFDTSEDSAKKGEVIQMLTHAITQYGAAKAGLKTGTDLSKLDLIKTDFERQFDRVHRRREFEEAGLNQELGARRRLQELIAERKAKKEDIAGEQVTRAAERGQELEVRAKERAEDKAFEREMLNNKQQFELKVDQAKEAAASASAPVPGTLGLTDAGKPQTETELKTEGQVHRMIQTNDAISKLPLKPTDSETIQNWMDALRRAGKIPMIGGALESVASFVGAAPSQMLDEAGKQYLSQSREFVAATLRAESGAAINAEEWATGYERYFPISGDSEQVIKDKEKLRQQAIQGMIVQTGRTIGRSTSDLKSGEETTKVKRVPKRKSAGEELQSTSFADRLFNLPRDEATTELIKQKGKIK